MRNIVRTGESSLRIVLAQGIPSLNFKGKDSRHLAFGFRDCVLPITSDERYNLE